MTRAALLLLLLAAPAWADGPRINIPSEIQAIGDYVVVTPDTTAKSIIFIGLGGADAFPSELLRDPRTFVLPVRGLPNGRYDFVAVGTLNDEQSRQTFTVVKGSGPPPPPPPPPPAPDAFQQALQLAFGVEAATPKLTQVRTLAAFYRAAAATTVNNPALKTLGDLQDALKVAVKQIGLPAGSLSGLVQIIASDEVRALGTDRNRPLDATTRALAAAEFLRVAAALEGVK